MSESSQFDSLEKLGSFELTEQLSNQGVLASFVGVSEISRQPALVVVVPKSDFVNSTHFKRFLDESELLKSVGSSNHHLCVCLEFGEEDGFIWSAYEWKEGHHIGEIVRDHGIPDEILALDWAAKALDAVKQAHLSGFTHRLINPASLFLNEDNQMMLLHLGWTNILLGISEGPANPAFMSILPFLSPEVAAGGDANPASDIYSIGANLFFFLTGQPLFWDEDPYRLIESIVTGAIDWAPLEEVISGEALELIQGMLQLDPKDRPSDIGFLKQRFLLIAEEIRQGAEFDRYSSAEIPANPPPAAPAPPPPPPTPKPAEQAPPEPKQEVQKPKLPTEKLKAISQQEAPVSVPDPFPTQQNVPRLPGRPDSDEVTKPSPSDVKPAKSGNSMKVIFLGGIAFLLLSAVAIGGFFLVTSLFGDRNGAPPPAERVAEQNTRTVNGQQVTFNPEDQKKRLTSALALYDLGEFMQKYFLKYGNWPFTKYDLLEFDVPEILFVDAWGNEIDLRRSFVVSAGKDGKWDTSDDFWYDVDEKLFGAAEEEFRFFYKIQDPRPTRAQIEAFLAEFE